MGGQPKVYTLSGCWLVTTRTSQFLLMGTPNRPTAGFFSQTHPGRGPRRAGDKNSSSHIHSSMGFFGFFSCFMHSTSMVVVKNTSNPSIQNPSSGFKKNTGPTRCFYRYGHFFWPWASIKAKLSSGKSERPLQG